VYNPEDPTSLRLLAAHIYYRALSSVSGLIRSWLFECKDRQLSSAVMSYTSKHFSPILVKMELDRMKGPEAAELLDDEHMAIKVATAVNEVTASYTIDEQQIEVTLKIPADWPLHAIEVKDSEKSAIKKDKWRTWVLGIQQITWSQVSWLSHSCREELKTLGLEWKHC
jgi:E3 ubiquitin-protein ligase listerin